MEKGEKAAKTKSSQLSRTQQKDTITWPASAWHSS
jgi:hypothetical protein